ncbi:type VI secretion system baseplate subunit TssG [Prevotella sp. 10(H)]|uniref:type VI secretion system baseplate subunit TssG n=1 Tax=Prevotella sp. 10(H) TaxID=1158294 RepID=UPI0004A77852|nr:type VI secretion system baseplate subunit TssG [Prevotella sp. 10(H)]
MKKLPDINTIDTNFRAEVVASHLIGNAVDSERLLIVRHKGNKKEVSKDIDKLDYQYSYFDMMEYLYIYTNRESIYDSLPEGLFHQSSTLGKQKNKEDIIREIRSERGREKDIRKFFLPFEIAIDKLLIDAQEYEQKYDKVNFYSNLTDIVKGYWNILQYLNTEQALLFIKIVSIINEIPGNLNLTAKVMSIILDCPVKIEKGEKSRLHLEKQDKAKLGDWKLGVNSILGNTMEYGNLDLIINIGPINLNQMRLFEANRTNDLILAELIDLLIPFNHNTVKKYEIAESEAKFRLSGKNHTAYLGINTRL